MDKNTWVKGKSGDWLIRGSVGQSGTVTVTKKNGDVTEAEIAKCVWEKDGVALYTTVPRGKVYDPYKFNGYGRSKGGYVRACKSGGNCSSIGSGRSCGAADCDGF